MTDSFHLELAAALGGAAESERSVGMRAYLRGQFDFLGVATPQRRAAVKPILKSLKGVGAAALLRRANELWELPEREYQYVAIDLLAMHWKELETRHVADLIQLAQKKSWWDSVDGLASLVGDVLRGKHEGMDDCVRHPNMWVRRIALLHQLGWRQQLDQQRLFAYCLMLAPEKEFFIQKAIGWALRDYAHHNPAAVRSFLQAESYRLPALSYREANKHLKNTSA
ncbi:DNA alkylation repair protein [Rugamonas sp. CCM 8940]|uniref:DNA alkylation repair protein n=1 Tax=Rugamonas sp. CCM 8940 TaxID=2765359 RepID=UPI0018F5E6F4|nr:DNA alkylation repair protein [Rugamonas sp. CCM 8940]MBJ7308757.1 DNA alkylation repair protein [Rugamonas sp. CCM 8940]